MSEGLDATLRHHLRTWHDLDPTVLAASGFSALMLVHDGIHDDPAEVAALCCRARHHTHRACRHPGCTGHLFPHPEPRATRPAWYLCDRSPADHQFHSNHCIDGDGSFVCVCGLPPTNPKEHTYP